VIKLAALTGVLVLLISFLLIACASDEETLFSKPSLSENTSSSPDVPGEKTGDEGRVSPGAMGSTNVHW
jgi:hypothetical protein